MCFDDVKKLTDVEENEKGEDEERSMAFIRIISPDHGSFQFRPRSPKPRKGQHGNMNCAVLSTRL